VNHDDRATERLLSQGKEVAPPDFLERLERATQEAYRAQRRLRRTRQKLLGACAAVAAVVPLAWAALAGPETPRITAEQFTLVSDRSTTVQTTRGADPREAKAAPLVVEQPEPLAPKPPPAASAKPRPPALSQEIAVLAQVRRALETGEPRQALAVLDRHSATLRAGQLRLEADVLRLEALSKLGAKQEANERARSFIDQNPNSPLADRVRGFVNQ